MYQAHKETNANDLETENNVLTKPFNNLNKAINVFMKTMCISMRHLNKIFPQV